MQKQKVVKNPMQPSSIPKDHHTCLIFIRSESSQQKTRETDVRANQNEA